MITVENVSKSFRPTESDAPVQALHEVNLDVDAGALFGVVGEPGAGKSTLARCVGLRERPDRGSVRYDGLNTTTLDGRKLREAQSQVAVVDSRLRPERTVAGNVAAPLERVGVDGSRRRQRVATLLDVIGLTRAAAQVPADLTPGQQRRVSVARALAGGPAVLLADDPTEGVDADESGAVLSVLDRARAELGATVLLTTSDEGVARRVCDDVALLDHGSIVESGNLLTLAGTRGSRIADELLPSVETSPSEAARFDVVVDVVLVGFASVGALLPEAGSRFDVDIATIGGGLTRFGDTPVARFRIGLRGQRADAALAWMAERGAHVTHTLCGLRTVAA
ncbi:ATP-binding cassette domain-containing protein [Prauserella halophila]|uniref:ATP-binding cassette domain-containing protein n=1 Tax=Prauserella halophila TaxID=185641 RepID=A0ABN1WAA1_9PSEU|nr:ATP-binding cassette domain-containing protein [Prauserella halophila]MCP2235863.1 D-methionine transport system ATP-binding protein [Prauserella halophila]